MKKEFLKDEQDFYDLLDDIYNIIGDDNINKATFSSKKEQYDYQIFKAAVECPPIYPCVMIYDILKTNGSDYRKPNIYNKDYYFITSAHYVTLNDFK